MNASHSHKENSLEDPLALIEEAIPRKCKLLLW